MSRSTSAQVAGLQRADVDHHVDLARAVEDRAPRLVALDVGGRRAERKPDDRADADAAARAAAAPHSATQVGLTQTVANLNCAASRHSSSMSCARRVRLEQRVVDHRRDAGRRAAASACSPTRVRAGVEHAAQPVRTAVVEHRVARAARRCRRAPAAASSSTMMSISRCSSSRSSRHPLSGSALELANLRQPPNVARLAHRRRQPGRRRSPAPRPA